MTVVHKTVDPVHMTVVHKTVDPVHRTVVHKTVDPVHMTVVHKTVDPVHRTVVHKTVDPVHQTVVPVHQTVLKVLEKVFFCYYHDKFQVSATDPECGKTAPVKYFPTGASDLPSVFTLDESTGQICIQSNLDYETTYSYNFLVKAVDLDGLQTTTAIKITVTDVNDNKPVFDPSSYKVNVEEDFSVGKTILNVQAQDQDSGFFGDVLYTIETGNSQGYFDIDRTSGVISLAKSLPNVERTYQLLIQASDGDGVESTNPATVIISVIRPNSERPKFEFNQYSFDVAEDVNPSTLVGSVIATTQSPGSNIQYEILSTNQNWFRINNQGSIYTVGRIDRETKPSVLLNIQAESGLNPVWATTQVNITIADVNDNKPEFTIYGDGIRLPVKEDVVVGTSIYGVHANDKDDGLNGTVRYKLLTNPKDLFDIDALSGEIRLKNELDYETNDQFLLKIVAHDQGTPQQESSTATVTIDVIDVNDNVPIFTKRIYDFNVKENAELNSKFGTVNATDKDSSHHGGQMSFGFAESPYTDIFGMYPTGELYVKRDLDREIQDLYVINVVVTDIGQIRLSSTATVRIHVTDANDNRPSFTQSEYHFDIEENQQVGSTVGQVVALDRDTGINAELHYSFKTSQNKFVINPHNGEITTKTKLDREDQGSYQLEVKVVDKGATPLDGATKVKITVLDMNDNKPKFQGRQPYSESVLENKPKGTEVIQMVATDPDAAENGFVSYVLDPASTSADGLQNFAIHPKTGWITTKEVLDYEQRSRYLLVVIAKDGGNPGTDNRAEVEIKVKDDNDEAPLFHASKVTFDVIENSPIRTTVGRVQAHDLDSGENGRVSYYIMSGNVFSLFAVDMSSGEIYSIREIDYEESSSHVLGIKAIDNNILYPRSNNISVTINIIDLNDNQPKFEKDPIILQTIKENSMIGQVVYTFTAVDRDSGLNGTVQYSIKSETSSGPEPNHGSYFTIDSNSGQLKIANNIDYEKVHQISLIVKAQDRCPSPSNILESSVTTVVFIMDTNDNYPIFESRTSIHVSEDESVGYPIMHVIAVDKDSNKDKSGNNIIVYNIISGNEDKHFKLDSNSGLLTISSQLDREKKERYFLNISAEDHGSPKRTSYKLLNIIIDDVNDNIPQFNNNTYYATVPENTGPGATLITVTAVDNDIGDNGKLTYLIPEGIADNLFEIEAKTGVITTRTELDREIRSAYIITVYVQDGGYPTQYDMTTVVIEVEDINDNSPIFQSSSYSLNIPENRPESSVMAFVAHDADDGENAVLSYSIIGGNDGHFLINGKTGELTCTPLDREVKKLYNLTVSAVDGGTPSRRGQANVFIQVLDENDNNPVFSRSEYSKTIKEDIAKGEVVLQVSATDKDYGHNGEVTFSLGNDTEGFFSVNSTSGEIITTGVFDREKKGQYNFEIIAHDGGISGPRNASAIVRITLQDVNDNAPVFNQVPYRVDVPPNTDANKQILIVGAKDPDLGENKKLTYNLQSESGSTSLQYFRIDPQTGEIVTKQSLSNAGVYHNLKVVVLDNGNPRLSSTGVVEITVGTTTPNPPLKFKQVHYSVEIREHSPTLTPVIRVSATSSVSGTIRYSFANGNDDQIFSIDQNTGEIKVANSDKLDYEVSQSVRMVVAAEQYKNHAYATLQVNLTDINDNSPKFAQTKYVSAVWESNEPETYVTKVLARDADSGYNGRITYNIIGGNKDRAFVIDPPHTGIVKTNIDKLDREIRDSYRLVIQAIDEGEQPKSSSCILSISIIDVNDNQPYFPPQKPVFLKENMEIGSHVTTVTASDVDPDHSLIYDFSTDGNPENTFNIDRLSGRITLAKPVDHEQRKHYMIDIKVSDGLHTDFKQVDINIDDINDNSPDFSQKSYQVSLPELTSMNYPVISVNATDKDTGQNSDITYSISDNPLDSFYIDSNNGTIFTKKSINNTTDESILQLVVTATDNGRPRLSSMVTVHIQITSVNKFAPIFDEQLYMKNISEASNRGDLLLQVRATDKDNTHHHDDIDYTLISGSTDIFQIRRRTGEIFLNGDLDREKVGQYTLKVMATDRGDTPKSSTSNINIIVTDVNDNAPYFLEKDYFKILPENFTSEQVFLIVGAEDADIGPNADIQYTITSGNGKGLFIIHGTKGEISIMTGMELDYETDQSHRLIIRAVDCKSCPQEVTKLSAFVTVDINVTDINDSKPKFPVDHYVESVYENRPVRSIVFQAHANDRDSGMFGLVRYSLIPGQDSDYFTMDSDTGYVRTQMSFDYEERKAYRVRISGVDIGGLRSEANVTILIRDEDEFAPTFIKKTYDFDIQGNAKKGDILGQVGALDEDGGEAGKVYFYFKYPSSYDYFAVNASSGVISVARSFHEDVPEDNRVKRALKEEETTIVVIATSGLDNSMESTATIAVKIDRTCDGCKYVPSTKEEGLSPVVLALVIVVCIIIVIVVIVIAAVLFIRKRKHKAKKAQPEPRQYEPSFDQIPPAILHPNVGPPPYRQVSPYDRNIANITSSDISNHSHNSASSGRGSAEEEEDEEIRMINSNNFINHSQGYLRRKAMPDSGIQQDDDSMSEPSVQNHQEYLARLGIDSTKIGNKNKKKNVAPSVESMHHFSDEGGGEGDIGIDYNKLTDGETDDEVAMIDKNRVLDFPNPEKQHAGSLSSVINSEEEYSGSYNWDYLLDWGPQYQPLAHVFAEIAKLKDDNVTPKKQPIRTVPQKPLLNKLNPQVKMVPPPMITNTPPKAISQPASRTSHSSSSSNQSQRASTMDTSLPSLPRSPISYESNYNSPALTPSFTPSLSPLAAHTPSTISPAVSSQVNSGPNSGQNTPGRIVIRNGQIALTSASDPQEFRI
ncbi:hypothetical protein LOTGIDRAFT_174335 [Lottia gigantea]|uniref:Cadherin domain-containing protein n=1 Tax=Lottia gigantea TaxID=225164 RepID=V4AX38_LOTGI|nr:hypothetical protein LOTGIDRAFT_174335 [Lottia gigantea]ESO98121.1 hypothetical protein LOTGIDRAFT_174335 [Lottia gigantea]